MELPGHFTMVENLIRVYYTATCAEITEGRFWYAETFNMAKALAEGTDYTTDQCVALIAAISPSLRWEALNVSLPAQFIAVHSKGESVVDHSWPIRNYGGVRKAQRILDGDLSALTGLKIEAFARNIAGDYYRPTVDGWMVRIIHNDPGMSWRDLAVSSKKRYDKIANAIVQAAQAVGETPAQFQAICWVTFRNKYLGKSRQIRKEREDNAA